MLKQHFDALSNHARELGLEVQERTRQLERSREQILQCLARAAEYRDNETGRHVVRVGKYCRTISEQLGLPVEFCKQIELAAQLHDLGKLGIPDSILLSPDKLTTEQFETMKKHCDIGRAILNPFAAEEIEQLRKYQAGQTDLPASLRAPMLSLAARIAQTHHEKYDGTGYPLGLSGEQIPIEGRITAVADVYDALCSKRPYKEDFPVEKALGIMLAERGTRFDPVVLDAFFEKISTIEKIRHSLQDETPG
jgi:putative two-component system response regulator